jgi:septal ring factor EnvC (AmiA/AmiB activator)
MIGSGPASERSENTRKSDTMAKKTTSKKQGMSLNTMSLAELQQELQRREKGIRKLERRRERLLEDLAQVDTELASVGALGAAGRIRRRPRNDMNLVDSLATVLKGKTMSVTDVTQAVQKAGYITTAANFRTIVNQALIREKKVFKKVSRGQYTAK